MLREHRVRIQVIKVYDVWVEAKDDFEALQAVEEMDSLTIQRDGKLIDVSTDFAEYMDVGDVVELDDDEFPSDAYDRMKNGLAMDSDDFEDWDDEA